MRGLVDEQLEGLARVLGSRVVGLVVEGIRGNFQIFGIWGFLVPGLVVQGISGKLGIQR